MPIRPNPAALTALAAAALFGATTPLAKVLLGELAPFVLAGLFYVGSGIGLAVTLLARHGRRVVRGAGTGALAREPAESNARIAARDIPWLAGAIAAGGVCGPALLMFGLRATPAASASLLLNLEGVFTAAMAWWLFHENVDLQILLGMIAIVAGGVALSWQPGVLGLSPGALFIAAACLCWAIDNNLTRKISTHDATVIACVKGLVAGSTNLAIGLALGGSTPKVATIAAAMAIGFAGYGVSLVLFIVALRHLGTARTGAYFSVAPLIGVVLSLVIWPAWPSAAFWCAALLMGLGVWLHLRERHLHEHTHEPLEHSHPHRHDDGHHRHEHDFAWDGQEPHTHAHRHLPITHTHAHYPDIHHRHRH